MIAEAEKRLRSLSMRAATTGERVRWPLCKSIFTWESIVATRQSRSVWVHYDIWASTFRSVQRRPKPERAYDGIWTRLGARAIEDLDRSAAHEQTRHSLGSSWIF